MGRQTGQDKMYITSKEWSEVWGGHKGGSKRKFKRLPFHCCALSLTDFTNPLLTPDGFLFDIANIVPFVRKYHINPVTGEPLSGKDLIKAHFHKNAENQYACPVTGKVFNENTKIAVIKPTGNVYSWDAINELCLQPKNFKDLTDDTPFTKDDIIVIQDPSNDDWNAKHDVTNFYHVRKTSEDGSGKSMAASAPAPSINLPEASKKVLQDLSTRAAETATTAAAAGLKRSRDMMSGGDHVADFGVKTTGKFGASFTSTGMNVRTRNEAAEVTAEDIRNLRYLSVKKLGKKAFVRLVTNKGSLNLELQCDLVPRTCENFLLLASRGYYNGTRFHRLIRNFMLQGGDPTSRDSDSTGGSGGGGKSVGSGGESAWGGTFPDEFHPKLGHSERGVLSMANSGPDTNKSQFFITFKSAPHLDKKHTVFGKVVGGMETLRDLELTPTDKEDRPMDPIELKEVIVFQNPFDEVREVAVAGLPAVKSAAKLPTSVPSGKLGSGLLAALAKPSAAVDVESATTPVVGAYVPAKIPPAAHPTSGAGAPKVPQTSFSNFDNW